MPPTRSMSISREAKSVLGLRRALFVSWAQLLATGATADLYNLTYGSFATKCAFGGASRPGCLVWRELPLREEKWRDGERGMRAYREIVAARPQREIDAENGE